MEVECRVQYKSCALPFVEKALSSDFWLESVGLPELCRLALRVEQSSYYSINGGKVDLINQLPARASPFLSMTEATSMVGATHLPIPRNCHWLRSHWG